MVEDTGGKLLLLSSRITRQMAQPMAGESTSWLAGLLSLVVTFCYNYLGFFFFLDIEYSCIFFLKTHYHKRRATGLLKGPELCVDP